MHSPVYVPDRDSDFDTLISPFSSATKQADDTTAVAKSDGGGTPVEDMSLLSITDGENARGIPFVKFIDDVEAFAKVELPLWLSYGLGGGKSTSAAAITPASAPIATTAETTTTASSTSESIRNRNRVTSEIASTNRV